MITVFGTDAGALDRLLAVVDLVGGTDLGKGSGKAYAIFEKKVGEIQERVAGGRKADEAAEIANRTIAGSGAKLENLGASEIQRIQNAANRSGQEITVVGSRAGGTARPSSDWDYVIDANSKTRNSLSRSLPGAGNTAEGIRPNIDVFKGQVDETKPFIRFFPETKP